MLPETQRLCPAWTCPRSKAVAWRGRDDSSIQGGGWWAVARDCGDEGIWGGTGEPVERKKEEKINESFLCNEWHVRIISP
jgi:hypothetical protein